MKRHKHIYIILFFISIGFVFLISFTSYNTENKMDIWGEAKWIAYKQLDDSLKIIPGVHGKGNRLGEKGRERSIVPMFRKDFVIKGTIKNASIHISGLGHYELYINGAKIGDRFLSPGWTNYQKRELFNSYDITKQIINGGNTIGVLVGNGFYNINRERYRKLVIAYGYPKLIFNIKIVYTNGSIENIVSDESCKVTPSPIVFSSIYGGEDYDARLEQQGWSNYGFNDQKWRNSVLIDDTTKKLVPEKDFPLKVIQKFKTLRIFKSKTGRTIYDFGQNTSGIISLKVKGSRGAQIIIRPDELLNKDQNITQRSGGGPYEFNYTLKGEGTEEWQPRFSYYGFRYVDVEIIEPDNAKSKTEIVELNLLHTRNSSPVTGLFQCSDTLFNKIFDLINWGIKSNMASVATDCPHREKLGWLEQTYLIGPSMHYNFDIQFMYTKIVEDMIDSQLDNGLVPDIAPEYVPFKKGFRDSPEWGSASVIIPWQIYKWYGSTELLDKAFPMMTRYMSYLHGKLEDGLLHHGLGDWYDLGPKHPGVSQLTPKTLTASAIYYYDLKIISKIAKLLNKNTEVKKFEGWAEDVKKAFQIKFYNPKTHVCSSGSQTAYAMALYTGILPKKNEEKVFKNLVDSIEKNDFNLTSGDIGYHFLVRVLIENGRSDVLYKMNNRSDRPGYGYQLQKGATALTESWEALSDVSNNHMMLGHLMEWFYSGLGGIYQAENSVAYKNLIIAPKPVGDIRWVKCSFKSPQGLIVSEWKRNGNKFTMHIEIPKKSSAKIILPDEFKNSKIVIVNILDQKPMYVEMNEGIFYLESGNFRIISNK